MSNLPPHHQLERAVRDHMDLVYDLCSVDDLGSFNRLIESPSIVETRLSDSVNAWASHLRLPLEILRQAAPIAESNLGIATHLALPCLQLVSAVCSGKYPNKVGRQINAAAEIETTMQSFTENVMEDMLMDCGDSQAWMDTVTRVASSNRRWTTIEQSRRFDLVCHVIKKWRKGHGGAEEKESKALSKGHSPSSGSWWIKLLLNSHSIELRKEAAFLMVVIIHRMRAEERRPPMTEEDEEEEEEEKDDRQDMDMDFSAGESNHGLSIIISGSPSRGATLATSPFQRLTHCGSLRHSLLRTRVLDVLMSALDHAMQLKVDDASLQLFGLIRHMASDPSRAAFLTMRGALPFLCEAGRRDIARLRIQESRALAGLARPDARDPGLVILQLVEVLKALFQNKQIRRHRLQHHMTDLLRLVVGLKLSLVLQSSALKSALTILQDLVSPPASDDSSSVPPSDLAIRQGERQAYLLAATKLLRESGSRPGGAGQVQSLFLLRLYLIYIALSPISQQQR